MTPLRSAITTASRGGTVILNEISILPNLSVPFIPSSVDGTKKHISCTSCHDLSTTMPALLSSSSVATTKVADRIRIGD